MCLRFHRLGPSASDSLEGSRCTRGIALLVNPEYGKCSLEIRFAYPQIHTVIRQKADVRARQGATITTFTAMCPGLLFWTFRSTSCLPSIFQLS